MEDMVVVTADTAVVTVDTVGAEVMAE